MYFFLLFFSDASKSLQERIRLKTISDQEIIEEITIEGSDKPNVSRNTCIKNALTSPENKNKRQRTSTIDEEISIINQQANDKCTPGPSGETWRNTKSNRLKSQDVSFFKFLFIFFFSFTTDVAVESVADI